MVTKCKAARSRARVSNVGAGGGTNAPRSPGRHSSTSEHTSSNFELTRPNSSSLAAAQTPLTIHCVDADSLQNDEN